MYQQAATQLTRAADQVAEYRNDLTAFADTLAGQRWGVDVTGPIQDMDGRLGTLEGTYRDLAGQMRMQGDQGAAAYDQAPWVPSNLLDDESCPLPAIGTPIMADTPQPEPTESAEPIDPSEADDLDLDDDLDDEDEKPSEPEVFTTCWECEEPLEQPTTREEDAVHPECDPDKPPPYWMGGLTPNGKKIDRDDAEPFRRLKNLAEEAFDRVLEWETPYGETFISFPDGSIVDAREWIERPENLELAGGRDQYAGRGEFDPNAPDRCWMGQTLPSGRLARPLAQPYENVGALAAKLCKELYEEGSRRLRDKRTPYTVMLPGGELVDAHDWAQRPETRQLAGYTPVEFDPAAPARCWLGPSVPSTGPTRRLATSYEDVSDLAAHVCTEVFNDRIHSRNPFTVMLPGGELVDAHDWAQRPETRRLAGCTTVRNRVQFTATSTCSKCGTTTSCTAERIVQGTVGEQQVVDGVLSCDTCEAYLSITPVPVTLVDDASAVDGAPPRVID